MYARCRKSGAHNNARSPYVTYEGCTIISQGQRSNCRVQEEVITAGWLQNSTEYDNRQVQAYMYSAGGYRGWRCLHTPGTSIQKYGDLLANHENNFTKLLAYDYLIPSSGLKWDKRLQHHIVISNVCTLWTETVSSAIYSGAQGVVKQAWPKAALVYNTIIVAVHYHYLRPVHTTPETDAH